MPGAVARQDGDARTQEMLRDEIQMPVAIEVCQENTTRAALDDDRRGRPGHEEGFLGMSLRTAVDRDASNQRGGELPHGRTSRIRLNLDESTGQGRVVHEVLPSRIFG